MDYIEIINWKKYQHYKDRNPPWIKLYHSLLDDYEYGCLQNDSKLLLISLFLLAARTDNQIPNDLKWIKEKSSYKGKINLQPLENAEFIRACTNSEQDAINPLSPEEKRRDREETEKKEIFGSFKNVKLTVKERLELEKIFGKPGAFERIENISNYIASKGDGYKSHYATILNWERKNKKPESSSPTCKECGHKGLMIGSLCVKCHDQAEAVNDCIRP